jgi:hypothetical protein
MDSTFTAKDALPRFFLEPGAGVAGQRVDALVLGLEQLPGSFRGGRKVVADGEGQHDEADAQQQQGAQRPPRTQAAGAKNGVFRALCQPRHHEDGADEHGDRQQLVQMAGDQQQHVDQRLHGTVVKAVGPADGLQLVDEVEEEEQAQKAERHERDGLQHLRIDQASYRFHVVGSMWGAGVAAARLRLMRKPQLFWRALSHARLSSNTPPCKVTMKPAMLKRPELIQLCPMFSML